jgi:pimeloyl-ACP methyl ester carboxylesterase
MASPEAAGSQKRILMIYANYDLTFPKEYSLQALEGFRRVGLNCEVRVLPCGHYTTGETPYKFIDGWYMGSFVHRAYKALREEKAAGLNAAAVPVAEPEEEAVSR